MAYDFDEPVRRLGSASYKWDAANDPGVLPMWVADMDFKTAPCVIEALEKRARHGVFGYTKIPDAYFDATAAWFKKRHAFGIKREWILPTTGVLPAIAAVIRALTKPGDKIILQTPAYNCFFPLIKNGGCEALSSGLIYENGAYSMDFDDFEAKASDPAARLFLLCSPHNPAGRVWKEWELERIGETAVRHGLTVVSDEIHCDLTFKGNRHMPFASLGKDFLENSVTCTSPSKTFNIAGLQAANVIAADPQTRRKIADAMEANEVSGLSPFAVDALVAAYNGGGEWLDELRDYLYGNYEFMLRYLGDNLPRLRVLPLEATYLAWVDCSALGIPSAQIAKTLFDREKLWINAGTMYGPEGEGFIRINLACPRKLLKKGLDKIKSAFAGA